MITAMYDVDYEIYKYINEQAKHYVQFDTLLKQKNITFKEAHQKQFSLKNNLIYCFQCTR